MNIPHVLTWHYHISKVTMDVRKTEHIFLRGNLFHVVLALFAKFIIVLAIHTICPCSLLMHSKPYKKIQGRGQLTAAPKGQSVSYYANKVWEVKNPFWPLTRVGHCNKV